MPFVCVVKEISNITLLQGSNPRYTISTTSFYSRSHSHDFKPESQQIPGVHNQLIRIIGIRIWFLTLVPDPDYVFRSIVVEMCTYLNLGIMFAKASSVNKDILFLYFNGKFMF